MDIRFDEYNAYLDSVIQEVTEAGIRLTTGQYIDYAVCADNFFELYGGSGKCVGERYHHTHDFKGYCKRLGLFALISEIPFNLMIFSSPIYPFHQNVMLTLLLGLLACRAYDQRKWLKLALWVLLGAVSFCDYGAMGVMTVLMFHVFRGQKSVQLLLLVAINWFGFEGQQLVFGGFQMPVQAFAIGAALPIFLYGGEKGRGGKWLQYGSYLFYPMHMLILWLIRAIAF